MWYGSKIIMSDVEKYDDASPPPVQRMPVCSTQVPYRAEEITIPADVTPERVPTHIVDYSGIL